MYKWLLLLSLFAIGKPGMAQQIKVPDLITMLEWDHLHIDTTLKKKGYLLMQKEVDSASALYQYSNLERQADMPANVRSFMYMDVTTKELQSRLITYRTYSKEEYGDLSAYLLTNQYHATNKFDFGTAKHTLYSNGTQTITMKVISNKMKDGRIFTAYELELGK